MNPFDLRGPQFLLFYAVLGATVLAFAWLSRRSGDVETIPSRVDDPYQLAALRGGSAEAIRVALLSLLDRRLLKAKEGAVHALAGADLARRPLERALLTLFRTPRPAGDAFGDGEVGAAAAGLEEELTRSGLVDPRAGSVGAAAALAVGVLVAVAGLKVVIALSRGRANVGFLVIAAVVLTAITLKVGARPRRTLRGEKALALAERAFARLKHAAAAIVPGGQTNELALAFAVFGAGVLPPLARDLLVEARIARTAAGGGASCGSSCGSSSSCGGSSCGGGCGGGGCGGCGS